MKYYSIKNMSVAVNGVPIFGLGEGDDVLQGRRLVDTFTHQMGVQGNMLVIGSANKSGEVIIKLQQGSLSNNFLNELFDRQEGSDSNTFDPLIVTINDNSTGDTAGGSDGYIPQKAEFVRGENANDHEWKIVVEQYDQFFGILQEL